MDYYATYRVDKSDREKIATEAPWSTSDRNSRLQSLPCASSRLTFRTWFRNRLQQVEVGAKQR